MNEFRATRDVEIQVDGHDVTLPAGTVLQEDHLAVEAQRDAFEPYDREAARERLRRRAADPRSHDAPPAPADGPALPARSIAEQRGNAIRALDAAYDRFEVEGDAGQRYVDVLERDLSGTDAAYVEAISAPAYRSAFFKKLSGGASPGAAATLNAEEAEALETVGRAMHLRSLLSGTGEKGGFALPIAIDSQVMLTSSGAVSPIRELATVDTIATSEWRGLTSAGITAKFDAEAAAAEDNAPTFAQPTITPDKAHAFVPFSIEAGMDWGQLEAEMVRLLNDAKAVLEAEKFTTGKGEESIPQGLLVGATEVVKTAEEGKLSADDIYTFLEKLPPRFHGNATWQTALSIANTLHRFSGPASEEPALFNDARDRLAMKPWYENSNMDAAVESEKKVAVFGDVAAGYRIIDRIGGTVELIPHLFNEAGLPKGERGMYFYWRVGAKVVNKAALRVLEVK